MSLIFELHNVEYNYSIGEQNEQFYYQKQQLFSNFTTCIQTLMWHSLAQYKTLHQKTLTNELTMIPFKTCTCTRLSQDTSQETRTRLLFTSCSSSFLVAKEVPIPLFILDQKTFQHGSDNGIFQSVIQKHFQREISQVEESRDRNEMREEDRGIKSCETSREMRQ